MFGEEEDGDGLLSVNFPGEEIFCKKCQDYYHTDAHFLCPKCFPKKKGKYETDKIIQDLRERGLID